MKPLKFKEIRKSIISTKESVLYDSQLNKSPLRRNLFGQNDTEKSFKSIKQSTMSPLRPIDMNIQNLPQVSTNKKAKFLFEQSSAERQNLSPLSNKKRISQIQRSKGVQNFDSQKKVFTYQRITSKFGSDQKENSQKSIYFGKQNKQNVNIDYGTMLNYNLIKERKLNTGRQNMNDPSSKIQSSINPINETAKKSNPGSLTKKNSCGMLFKTALQTSNKKKTLRNNLDSDRSNARQSSIGRLKQKLFGMKKIISEKENRQSQQLNCEEQETKSFSIYTDSFISPSSSALMNNKQHPVLRKTTLTKKTSNNDKSDDNMNFSNLVFTSINKGMQKPVFKNFINDERKESVKMSKMIQPTHDSRLDSVNISVAQSFDSILDMEPNI